MSKVTQQVSGTGKLPPFPSPSLFQCPGGWLAGDADPGIPSLPPLAFCSLGHSGLHTKCRRVGAPIGEQAMRGATCLHSQTGWHIPAGEPLCHQPGPAHSPAHRAIVCPRHFEQPLPQPPTPPHVRPLPGGAPRAEHPCPSPQPQRAATPPILEPSRDQRGEMTCPESHRPKSKPLNSLVNYCFLRMPPFLYACTPGLLDTPPVGQPGLALDDPCPGGNIPILQARKPTGEAGVCQGHPGRSNSDEI